MWRIITERKQVDKIEQILLDLGLGFTWYPAKGGWEGTIEESMVIEICFSSEKKIHLAAAKIGRINNQKVVLIQEIQAQNEGFLKTKEES